MDLDFSFALVSSLTPRSRSKKTYLGDNNDFSSQLLSKPKFGCCPKPNSNHQTLKPITRGKENCPPKDQLMNICKCCQPSQSYNVKHSPENSKNVKEDSLLGSLDMANIAVRKKRVTSNRQPQTIAINDKKSINLVQEKPIKDSIQPQNKILRRKNYSLLLEESRKSLPFEVTDLAKENCNSYDLPASNNVRRVSSSKVSLSSDCSTDVVESSFMNVEGKPSLYKAEQVLNNNNQTLRSSSRTSGLSDSLLSTAYDSDSITRKCKKGAKVIQETPETDNSFNNSLKKKRLSVRVNESLENGWSSSPLQCIEDNDSKMLKKPNDDVLPLDQNLSKNCRFAATKNERPKKKLKSNRDSSLTDIFKLESSIQNCVLNTNQKELRNDTAIQPHISDKDEKKESISPVLKVINNVKDSVCERNASNDVKGSVKKIPYYKINKKSGLETEITSESVVKAINEDKKKNRRRSKRNMPSPITNPKHSNASIVPPTDILPKSEHIRNWLKNTQETSVILIDSESSSLNTPTESVKLVATRTTNPVSLSPRIKKKMKVAKSSLEEEQKIFEELYGNAQIERLSGDIEYEKSISSCQESIEYSENVLDKLYGTFLKKGNAPQSVPVKGRKKPAAKKKNPQTERKKHRTSIFDVFSSSSSEDRFEEFLESVQRGKLKSKRSSNRPGTPDFIKDSDSDSNCSITFYHNIASSAAKEDANNIRHRKAESVKSLKRNHGRRLSFSSSKDDNCSNKGNSEYQNVKKDTKPSIKEKKKRGPRSKSKKQIEDEVEEILEHDKALFTLEKPLKIKDKKTDEKFKKPDNVPKPVPKIVGKSTTPTNIIKLDDKVNTEERLRKKYLGQEDFKVPKNVTSFKTPTKSIKKDVPYSPALSFLSSLSEVTANLPCHPDATVYKKDFKNKREELSRKLFNLYNKEIFENKLPEDMLIQWNGRMTSTSGYCYNKRIYSNNQIFRSSRIVLSTKILDRPVRLRDTLIHELCHAATWIVDGASDGHGPKWKAWADKAHRRFPELPVIKRCHDYAIKTKYTYKCMSCGYSIGRHSKSLDVERKRCGYCFGKFQLFVTTKMSSAPGTGSDQGTTNTRTPRNPNGFALFVKENYAAIKKENNVPHAQVMQLLSQKFAQVKISKQNFNKPSDTQ